MDQGGREISRKSVLRSLQEAITRRDLKLGRRLHRLCVKYNLDADAFFGTFFIRLYSLCGCLAEAVEVFNNVPNPSVYTWSVMISAHAKLGKGKEGVKLYRQMLQSPLKPDEHVLVAGLQACASIPSLDDGKAIHKYVMDNGFGTNLHIGSALMDMYAKCENPEEAYLVFNSLPKIRDIVTFNSMIAAYAHRKYFQQAQQLFQQLENEGMKPNAVTFVCIVKACASAGALDDGKLIHAQIIQSDCDCNVLVANTLVDMYAKCESLEDASKVFESVQNRDGVTWNAIITGYAQHGHGLKALQLFPRMQQEAMRVSEAFAPLLKACSSVCALHEARLIHARAMGVVELDVVVGNCLIDLYCKCGNLQEAQIVFDKWPTKTMVTWNSMIAGYTLHGRCHEAFLLFKRMFLECMEPTEATFICMLKACSSSTDLELGKQIHGQIIVGGWESDLFVGNSLIDLYVKGGSLEDARKVFDKLPERTVVTWNAMIAGYSQNGRGEEAFESLQQMRHDGIEPDDITFINSLKACTSIAALDQGKLIHALVLESYNMLSVNIENTLIDMYAKCGSLEDACGVFVKWPKQSITTWNTIIAAYAQCSDYKSAMQCYKDMQLEGLKPNDITFVCLLSSCSRMGLVDEGFRHFKAMELEHGVAPTLDHYSCMVDLFGRAGQLKEAEDLLKAMPFAPNIVICTSLLAHCRTHGNAEMGRRCFDYFMTLDFREASGYVLVSNVYAETSSWDDVANIQGLRRSADAWKKPGRAFLEFDNEVHIFIVGDESHPRLNEAYAPLDNLSIRMKEEGFLPHVDLVTEPVLKHVN